VVASTASAPLLRGGEQAADRAGSQIRQVAKELVLATQAGTRTTAIGPTRVGRSGASSWPRTTAAASMAWAGSSVTAISGVAMDQAPIVATIARSAQQ
jgi:hypothetical protein